MNIRTALAVSALALVAAEPALALTMPSGGVDPTTGLTTLATWVLTLVGIVIPLICAFKGAHAVAEGRHLGPYVGSAIGGMVLAFGGAYVLSHYGVT